MSLLLHIQPSLPSRWAFRGQLFWPRDSALQPLLLRSVILGYITTFLSVCVLVYVCVFSFFRCSFQSIPAFTFCLFSFFLIKLWLGVAFSQAFCERITTRNYGYSFFAPHISHQLVWNVQQCHKCIDEIIIWRQKKKNTCEQTKACNYLLTSSSHPTYLFERIAYRIFMSFRRNQSSGLLTSRCYYKNSQVKQKFWTWQNRTHLPYIIMLGSNNRKTQNHVKHRIN